MFTLSPAAEAEPVKRTLLHLLTLPDCTVILAVRADFYANLIDFKGLPAISSHQLAVPPLRGEAQRQARGTVPFQTGS